MLPTLWKMVWKWGSENPDPWPTRENDQLINQWKCGTHGTPSSQKILLSQSSQRISLGWIGTYSKINIPYWYHIGYPNHPKIIPKPNKSQFGDSDYGTVDSKILGRPWKHLAPRCPPICVSGRPATLRLHGLKSQQFHCHSSRFFWSKVPSCRGQIAMCLNKSIYYTWLLIKIPLSRNGHSSRIKILLSRNFRELHVYLSRGPCWPTTPLMKIRSPPAKLRQRITDHFLVAF